MKRVARSCLCCGRTSESHGDECRPDNNSSIDYLLCSTANEMPLSSSWQRIVGCPERLNSLADSIEDYNELLAALESAGLINGPTKGGVDIVDSTMGIQYVPVLPAEVSQPVDKLVYILGRIANKNEDTFRRFKRTLIENGEFRAIEIAQPSRETSPPPRPQQEPPIDTDGDTVPANERSVPEIAPTDSLRQADSVGSYSAPPTPTPLSEEGVRDMLYQIASFDDDTLRRYQRILRDRSSSDPLQILYNGLQAVTPRTGRPAYVRPGVEDLPRYVELQRSRPNEPREQYFGEEVDAQTSGPVASTSSQEGVQQVQVRAADTAIPGGPHVYNMLSHPRGLCVIFNIQHFPGIPEKNRPGSELDQERMVQLFRSFGFNVLTHVDTNSMEIVHLLERYATTYVDKSHDAFVCIIMSHGEQQHIYGSDYCSVKLKTIFELFNNSNCPKMRERPKIFLIQACRGRLPDNSCPARNDESTNLEELTRSMEDANLNEAGPAANDPNQSDAGPIQSTSKWGQVPESQDNERRISIWSDVYIGYAVVEDHESLRDATTGSWFLKAVYNVMAHESYRYDLDTLMELVTQQVLGRSARDGQRQCPEIRKIGWHKKLYFNPGL